MIFSAATTAANSPTSVTPSSTGSLSMSWNRIAGYGVQPSTVAPTVVDSMPGLALVAGNGPF